MGLLLLQGASDLNPRELFANNEQGLWLDPSQLSTLYQDSNGVTPCTAAGDPVGLILDQSRGGLGALGSELKSTGLVQLTGSATAATYNTTTGEGTAARVDAVNQSFVLVATTSGKWYLIDLQNTSANTVLVRADSGGGSTLYTLSGNTRTSFILAGQTIGFAIACNTVNPTTASFTVHSVREVPGNHAYQTTSASRPTLQTTGGLWYLSFDGSDDSLVTNSVDFTATDEMTVIAGVRKLSDAARGMVAELSANTGTNAGSFLIAAPDFALNDFGSYSKGSAVTSALSSAIAAPATRVLSFYSDISQDSLTQRINGTDNGSSSSDQGTANFGNYQLYIGRRGGTTLPYNGHIYQLIVRGRTTPTGKLLEAERFVARKTGVSF